MFTNRRLWHVAIAAALLGVTVVGPAQAATPEPARPHPASKLADVDDRLFDITRLFITSYRGGCTHRLSVIVTKSLIKTRKPVGGACNVASAMAVRRTVRILPARPGFIGAEYTRGLTATGVTYAYPTTVTMDFPDGTTDGTANYAGGYFDGVVYQFNRHWKNPVALFETGLYLGGIAYDIDTDTLWVLDSRADFEEGTGEIRNYTMDGTLLSSFVVKGASTPQPFGLAYDAKDNSLWISRIVGFDEPIVLEKYSTSGIYLRSVTTKLIGVPGGMEIRVRRWS